jgi:beta-propeller repeat-containing protein
MTGKLLLGAGAGLLACSSLTLPLEGEPSGGQGGSAGSGTNYESPGPGGSTRPITGSSNGSMAGSQETSAGDSSDADDAGSSSSESGGSPSVAALCAAGQYAAFPTPGDTTDYVCMACSVETFNTGDPSDQCKPCRDCGTLGVKAGCTLTRDAQCEHTGVIAESGTGYNDATDLAVDDDGNIWVVGHTWDNKTGNIGTFLQKFPQDGSAASYEALTTGGSMAWITIDTAGGIWVLGTTDQDFGGPHLGFSRDVFVRHYAGDAAPVTDQFGTTYDEDVGDISADAAGNVWVVGATGGDLSGRSFGASDAFLRKYPADGSAPVTRQFGGADLDAATGVAVDSAGNVWVSGRSFVEKDSAYNVWVSEFGPDSELLRRDDFGTSAQDEATKLAVDRAGNVWVVGYTEGALAEPLQGSTDAFVRKYPADGSAPVTEQLSTGGIERAWGVTVDVAGNVWVVGSSDCNIADGQLRNPPPITATDVDMTRNAASECAPRQPSMGDNDAFVRTYPADGSAAVTYQLGAWSMDSFSAAAPGKDGSVWATGSMWGGKIVLWQFIP